MWELLKEEDNGYFGIDQFVERSKKNDKNNLEPGTLRKSFIIGLSLLIYLF